MNFKTLTAIGAAAAVAGFLAAPQAKADGTDWIWDGDGSAAGPAGEYSYINGSLAANPASDYVDVIGYPQFDTVAIKVEWDGDNVIITTYTNYNDKEFNSGQSNAVPLADWLFDTDLDGDFETAVSPSSDTAADLLDVSGTADSVQAMVTDLGYANNSNFAHHTAVCDGTAADCNLTNRAPEVYATGTDVGDVSITFNENVNGTLTNSPFGDGNASYRNTYEFTLVGVNDTGDWDKFRVFWGTGWCANDTIEGTAVVPIPAAAWLFGSAIFGLGAVGWKRRSSAA